MTTPEPKSLVEMVPELRETLATAEPELARAISEMAESVCERLVQELRERVEAASELDDASVRDDLPGVLCALTQTFSGAGGIDPLRLLGPAHAAARVGQQFSIEEVATEYITLRYLLRSLAEQQLGRGLTQAERAAIASAIDVLLSSTLKSVAAQREARAQLEAQALGNFLSCLAHDVRNEINGFIYTIQALADSGERLAQKLAETTIGPVLCPELRDLIEDVEACRQSVDSTLTAMSRLLEAERVRDRPAMDMREVELLPLLRGVTRAVAGCARAEPQIRPILEHLQIICASDQAIVTEPDLLSTALINLVGNAMKHAPESDVRIVAEIDGSGSCRISVADQGPGIAPGDADRLFRKFERAGSTRDGLGLGLFIAQRATERIGGTLSLHSEPGRGCTFTIALPHRAMNIRRADGE